MLPYVRNLLFLAAFLAGWVASNWHSDSLELVASKAAQAVSQDVAAKDLAQAETLDKHLSRLRANEKTIIRENVKLVDKPVYSAVCLDPDGLRNANAAKNGAAVEPSARVPDPD